MRELILERLRKTNSFYEEVPGGDWIKVKCTNPKHEDSKPSAGINVESGVLHCFSCGFNELYMKLEEDDTLSEADALWKAKYQSYSKQVMNTYPDYDSIHETLLDRNKELFLPPVAHLLTEEWRGLTPELLVEAKAYYCEKGKYRGRYVFVFYQNGQQYGFDARIVDASANMAGAKWIRNRGAPVKDLVYPKDIITNRFPEADHIVIVEGVADALSYIQMGVPAIASFGMSPPSSRRIEELVRMGITKITMGFDNDAAGIAGTLKVLPFYEEWFDIVGHPMVNMVRDSGYNDANEFLVEVKKNGLKKDKTYDDGGDY